jgi:hypothetical protein
MQRLSLFWVVFFAGVAMCFSSARCEENAGLNNAMELEIIKKQAAEREKWKSQGNVTKGELVGTFNYWPFDRKAFVLESDGTGELYGGARGVGTWKLMWEFDEHYQMLSFQTQQVKRVYKTIKKDGKVWLIEGRELWRQGSNGNQLLRTPLDKAYKD